MKLESRARLQIHPPKAKTKIPLKTERETRKLEGETDLIGTRGKSLPSSSTKNGNQGEKMSFRRILKFWTVEDGNWAPG
jgi:hypothetical protein